jgi:hypothetical protein
MKKTIGWAAVRQDGGIPVSALYGYLSVYAYPSPGLVRVEIRECREKKRRTGKAGKTNASA